MNKQLDFTEGKILAPLLLQITLCFLFLLYLKRHKKL